MTARKHERGIALIIVLWVGLLVVAIAGAFIMDTRTSTQLTRNFLDNAEARALADGGVHLAIYELVRNDAETPWRRDGWRYRRAVPGGDLEIAIEDEAGKIDLNNADSDLLEGLFLSAGVDSDRASAIVQAIEKIRSGEKSRQQLLRSSGVPNSDIRSMVDAIGSARRNNSTIASDLRSRPGVSGRPFYSVDSLGQVPGITADLHALLRPALTVFGEGDIHYLTAPREALLAIPGITSEAVDRFLLERAGDEVTDPLDEFLVQGQARDYWREGESDVVTVKVLAQAKNGAKFVRIAVVEITGQNDQPFILKEWREGDTLTIWRHNPALPEAVGPEAPGLSGGAT